MRYVGIDWGTRRAAWYALDECGEMVEGAVSADQDGLARLVHTLGPDAYGCVEMMSGAVWVCEQLQACGWRFAVADARKVKAIAPLACKTDRVDAPGTGPACCPRFGTRAVDPIAGGPRIARTSAAA